MNTATATININPTNARPASTESTLRLLLEELNHHRRVDPKEKLESLATCSQFDALHGGRLREAIEANKTIEMVLPAFPGKSPNPYKVISPLPDYAEVLALQSLNSLASKLKEIYSPGVQIILCSDGRVFSDVIGMKEEDVSHYQRRISEIIKDHQLNHLTTFNLDDHYTELNFNQMREELMKTWGNSLSFLKDKIKRGGSESSSSEEQQANRMFCGMTRFLFEDSFAPGDTLTRSARQKQAKKRAYEVIRRSNAWSDLIEEKFPTALRLSIHPQGAGSKKLGIRLISDESWMTPWHGVAVRTAKGFELMKKSDAEALGAKQTGDGEMSHFVLPALEVMA